jgi:hypothetical protein
MNRRYKKALSVEELKELFLMYDKNIGKELRN